MKLYETGTHLSGTNLLLDELVDGLTDFRRDTLEARLSASRLFSASSMSSTDPAPGDQKSETES